MADPIDLTDLLIPEGWSAKPDGYGRDTCVITTPEPCSYFATIDWKRRGFRSGMTTIGPTINKQPFKGAGWKKKLVAAAVAWLTELGEPRKVKKPHGS